jgi:CheY-like chemotaxis protein
MAARFKTCLLIDDNYIDNFVTRKIVVRQSPGDAIEALKIGAVVPDVIFLDIRMPMMSGFEFLEEYDKLSIANKENIKIYMLSSSLDPTDMKQSVLNKYISNYIHKPITHKALDDLFAHDLSC